MSAVVQSVAVQRADRRDRERSMPESTIWWPPDAGRVASCGSVRKIATTRTARRSPPSRPPRRLRALRRRPRADRRARAAPACRPPIVGRRRDARAERLARERAGLGPHQRAADRAQRLVEQRARGAVRGVAARRSRRSRGRCCAVHRELGDEARLADAFEPDDRDEPPVAALRSPPTAPRAARPRPSRPTNARPRDIECGRDRDDGRSPARDRRAAAVSSWSRIAPRGLASAVPGSMPSSSASVVRRALVRRAARRPAGPRGRAPA